MIPFKLLRNRPPFLSEERRKPRPSTFGPPIPNAALGKEWIWHPCVCINTANMWLHSIFSHSSCEKVHRSFSLCPWNQSNPKFPMLFRLYLFVFLRNWNYCSTGSYHSKRWGGTRCQGKDSNWFVSTQDFYYILWIQALGLLIKGAALNSSQME